MQEKAKYPREIIQELHAAGLDIVEGTIYPLFNRLLKTELVTYKWQESGGHPRKYYSLTKKGQNILTLYASEWKKMHKAVQTYIQT